MLDKAHAARQIIDSHGLGVRLGIDGGINIETIKLAADSGVDTFVAGSAIFKSTDYKETIQKLHKQIQAS